ncbi:MAG: serine/threonine-protein kinase [Candidatus Micrarchaeota archaeon]
MNRVPFRKPRITPDRAQATPAEFAGAEPLEGRLIDNRYHIQYEIGRGGTAVVYFAVDWDEFRERAVKVSTGSLLAEDRKDHVLREAEILAIFDNDRIIRCSGSGLVEGRPFIVTELLDGIELNYAMESGISWSVARKALIELCHALESVHELGILHRDVKPANVFLWFDDSERLTIKLIDFGLAASRLEIEQAAGPVVAGTPSYMAPELGRGKPSTPACDVYSAGVILYRMLTGLPPVNGIGAELIRKKAFVDPEAPSVRTPERCIPRELDEIALRAVARMPEDRFQSAGELRLALEACTAAPRLPQKSPAESIVVGMGSEEQGKKPKIA